MLLRAGPEKAHELIDNLKNEATLLTKTIYNICAYMRNISRDEAWALTPAERNIIFNIIKSKIATMEKSKGQVNTL